MTASRTSLPVLIAAAALLSTAVVRAQAADPRPSHAGMDDPARHARWDEHRAEHVKALHEVLGIQPAQESAFQAFTATMDHPMKRDEGGPMQNDHARMQALTTPERLDRMKARMDEHVAAMRAAFDRRSAAAKALYAVLDNHQRRVMDSLPQLMGHGEHGMGGHGMDHDRAGA